MISQRKIEANRRNSLRSTGPRTPEGKARSAMNSLRHGAWSARAIAPGADDGEFRAFRRGMLLRLRPRGEEERHLAEEVILHGWRLQGVHEMEAGMYCRDQKEAAEMLARAPAAPPPGKARVLALSACLGAVLGRTMAGPRSAYTTLSLLEARTWRNYAACLERLRELQSERRRAAGLLLGRHIAQSPQLSKVSPVLEAPRVKKNAETKPPDSVPVRVAQALDRPVGYVRQVPPLDFAERAQNEPTVFASPMPSGAGIWSANAAAVSAAMYAVGTSAIRRKGT